MSRAMAELGTEDKSEVIPPKWAAINDIPYSEFERRILPGMEPMACSQSNVKKCCLKFANKADACRRLVEYSTGISSATTLTGRLRLWSVLIDVLKQGNVLRGRRGADRGFDPDYANRGCFALEVEETADSLKFFCIFVTGQVRVPLDPTRFPGWPASPDSFFVEFNESESRAEVRNLRMKSVPGYKLGCAFPKQCFPVPPLLATTALAFQNVQGAAGAFSTPDKRRRQLMDGGAESVEKKRRVEAAVQETVEVKPEAPAVMEADDSQEGAVLETYAVTGEVADLESVAPAEPASTAVEDSVIDEFFVSPPLPPPPQGASSEAQQETAA